MIRKIRTSAQRLHIYINSNPNSTISTISQQTQLETLIFSDHKNPNSLIPLQKLINEFKNHRYCIEPRDPNSIERTQNLDNVSGSGSETFEDLLSRYEGSSSSLDAKRFHLEIVKKGFDGILVLLNTVVNVYVRAGDLVLARNLFDEIPERNIVSWTCLISGYTRHKMPEEACCLFRSMVSEGFSPTHYTFGAVLRACQDAGVEYLRFGMQIHSLVLKTRYRLDAVVCNSLISMYGICCVESSEYARQVFDGLEDRNSITWNAMISVYSKRGDVGSGLRLLSGMQKGKLGYVFKPNEYTFGSLITATYSATDGSGLCLLEQMLSLIMKSGFLSDLYVGSALVSGLARFGLLDFAKDVFKQMEERNIISMNGLIVGLVKRKRAVEAVKFFKETMNLVDLNCDSYVVLLSACAEFSSSREGNNKGKEVHAFVLRNGMFDVKVAIGNGFVNMYSKCGSIVDACKVFKLMGAKDLVTWNSMISGFDHNGCFEESLLSFREMKRNGLVPSNYALISTLSSCANLRCIKEGYQLHSEGIKLGLDLDASVSNSLLAFYGQSGCLSDCRKVFSLIPVCDLISWNSIIGVLGASEGSVFEAIEYFINMMRDGWSLNKVTFINVLPAVSSLSILGLGRQVHGLVLKYCVTDDGAVENALLSFYGKCGEIDDCDKIFSRMAERRDDVSWNSLIAGYIHNGLFSKAMDVVWFMMQKGQTLDVFTFATVLSACASVATLERGMEIHARGIRACLESDVVVGSTLVDMYSKCGRDDYALSVFKMMPFKNGFSWNSMISGFARHGHGEKALNFFREMLDEGQKPDHVTFVGVLSACSHVGLVDEGFMHFESMSKKYGLVPKIEHYSCMVDLLGRAGELQKVEDFIEIMPIKPNVLMWRTVVGACCRANGGKSELGRHASEMLLGLEPQNGVNYVLISNMYASGGKWEEVAKARTAMKGAAVRKEAGSSWVTMKDGVHSFVAGDKSHPETDEIYAKLGELNQKMKDLGYVPLTKYSLYDLEVENKEEFLSFHSEKLAVSFVLIRTSGLPIRIMKNLRVCGDCHSAFCYISKIVGRQIILRDSNRFHHFVDGNCSCRGYW
ncbi:hypothetical protein GIB67_014542 [Kingdonia uniflora]|uniref:DYW domain-containing protein n=1 Tax=Kingdonia uniflora TaxID=39325 RepID=A0A7J7LJX3_9MAGN|nr:hypothetical protein GIB67_014542 [Kingdonia uniflora]